MNFHAHIYFLTEDQGADLREKVGVAFADARIGRQHNQPVGPHPRPMFQVAFDGELLPELLPWLILNRDGCSVLIHPETGDDLTDHTHNAMWLGEPQELDTSVFKPQA